MPQAPLDTPAEQEELFGPLTFNSELPFEVWAVRVDGETTDEERFRIGTCSAGSV